MFGESTHDNVTHLASCVRKIESALGFEIQWDQGITQGDFRRSERAHNTGRKTLVHFDANYITAILALSSKPQPGTRFYKHKATEKLCAREFEDYAWIDRETLARTWDVDAWECYAQTPHDFNTLYIFDGNYFHSGPIELTDGRLTQNYWFSRKYAADVSPLERRA